MNHATMSRVESALTGGWSLTACVMVADNSRHCIVGCEDSDFLPHDKTFRHFSPIAPFSNALSKNIGMAAGVNQQECKTFVVLLPNKQPVGGNVTFPRSGIFAA